MAEAHNLGGIVKLSVHKALYDELGGAAHYLRAMGDRYYSFILESYARSILALLDPPPAAPAEPVPSVDYQKLPTPCELSILSLEWCVAQGLRPSFAFTLHISGRQDDLVAARGVVRQMNADTVNHPFAPLVQVQVNEHLKAGEWYIEDEQHTRIGSTGVR